MPVASRAADSVSPVRPIVFSLLATAIPTAGLAAVATTMGASAVLILVGVGMVVFEVVIVVMVQRITPPPALGRVFGAINGASNTGKLVGALLVVAGSVVLVGAVAVWPLVTIGRVAAVRQRELAPMVNALRGLAIFEGASGPSLERIAAQLDEQDLPAETDVIRQGEPADCLFITRAGALRRDSRRRPGRHDRCRRLVRRDRSRRGAFADGDRLDCRAIQVVADPG